MVLNTIQFGRWQQQAVRALKFIVPGTYFVFATSLLHIAVNISYLNYFWTRKILCLLLQTISAL